MSDPLEREIAGAAPDASEVAPEDTFEADLASFSEVADKPREPQFETADQFREYSRGLGFSDDEIKGLIPPELASLEEVGQARDQLVDLHARAAMQLNEARDRVLLERDKMDYGRLVSTLKEAIPDLRGMSETMVNSLMAGLYQVDARVRAAWDGRYDNAWGWQDTVDRVAHTLQNEFAKRGDAEATSVKEMVAASVRGIGAPRNYEPPKRDFNKLTDAEFDKALREEHGFGSGLI